MSGKRDRLVFLNHWSEKPGGAEYSLLDILSECLREYEIHLITTESGFLVNRASEMGVKCHVIPCGGRVGIFRRDLPIWKLLLVIPSLLMFLLFSFRVSKLIKRIGPFCIHANVPKSHVLLYLLKLLGFRGRAVFHIREIFSEGTLPYRLYSMFLRGRQTEIIAISVAVKEALPPIIQNKARVIYNGVDIGGPAGVAELISCSSLSFVYIGRIVPWKGCHHLIEAFSRMKSNNETSEATLTLIGATSYGDIGYRNELKQLIGERGLGESVFLLDHREDPWRSVKKPLVFCTASIKEPFGRSVAEAQGCGLPVIGFDTGGIREIVENGVSGMLVPEYDIEAFSLAMERLFRYPDLREYMGDQGYKRAHSLFNKEKQLLLIKSAVTGKEEKQKRGELKKEVSPV